MKQETNTNQNIPSYIGEVKSIVSKNKVYPLKELFMQIRKNHPEVRSMRTLKKDIETYTEDFRVNSNNMIISKQGLLSDILSIIAN
jgi:hypothetical protein